ncbi:MAG TPA: hypothetical protein VGQ99_08960 [Tepidisphaeraceae bacterium]|jgi:hypothetical protein|nr:hypothetical protein [Tepidisphaeraceae bacterium]
MKPRLLTRFLTILSALLCLATAFLWIRGHYARDGIWYSTDSMRYSLHSYRGRIFAWTLSVAPNPTAMVWSTPLKMGTGFQLDSVADSWYAPYIGPSKGINLETDFLEVPSAWGGVDKKWLGFRYVRNDAWYPRAQLQMGYPTARSRAIFVPHWAVVLLTAILPAIALLRFVRNRGKIGQCRTCGYDLRATPGRCPECGTEPSPAQ